MKLTPTMFTVPAAGRSRLAIEYRAIANGKRFTKAERLEFGRMADRWGATLPEKKSYK
jgi:hypothetical protein